MGLEWSEQKRHWEWLGDIKGLVAAVGNGEYAKKYWDYRARVTKRKIVLRKIA